MRRCVGCSAEFDGRWRCPRCGWEPSVEDERLQFAPWLAHCGGRDAEYVWAELAEAEPRHFWFRSRRRLIVTAFRTHFAQARCFLDIGCGGGFVLQGLSEALPGLELAGSDLRSEALDYAAQRVSGALLFQMDARRMPFTSEFDVVGAFDVIEHIVEDEAVLSEMFRATRSGGGILVTVPQGRSLWSAADEFSHHVRRYSRGELVARVEAAGFEVAWATSFCSLLLPVLVLRRWYERLRRAPFDPVSELRIGAFNGVFERVMRVEETLLARGVSLPAGGSLLVVGRKP